MRQQERNPTSGKFAFPTSPDVPLLSYDAHADDISGYTATLVYRLVPSFINEAAT